MWRLLLDKPLDIQVTIAERAKRFGTAPVIGIGQFVDRTNQPHAAPATAGHRLDDHGGTRCQPRKKCPRLLERHGSLGTGHDGHAACIGQLPRFGFVAEDVQEFRTWPDKRQAVAPGGFRKLEAFAEKAVSGMDGIAAGLLRYDDKLRGIQIGRGTLARYLHGAVGPSHMQALRIVFSIDSDGLDTEFRSRARDTDGDLAAIGNK